MENKVEADTDKVRIPKIGSLFIKNSVTFDYAERQRFYLEKEWEYEKRSVSSLLIGSGGGLSLMLANANIETGVLALTPSVSAITIIFFLFSLLFAGASQFFLNEAASLNHQQFTMKSNYQNYSNSVSGFDKKKQINSLICHFIPTLEIDDEANEDNRFKAVDRANVTKKSYLALEKRASKFERIAGGVILLSCVAFFLPIFIIVISVVWNIL